VEKNSNNKKLLFSVTKDDLEIQTFAAGGKGGQHQNKTETGVRIIHRESGAVGESRSTRSQHENKKLAFDHMVKSKKFQTWIRMKSAEIITGKTIEEKV
jgi:protein subunit release factor B